MKRNQLLLIGGLIIAAVLLLTARQILQPNVDLNVAQTQDEDVTIVDDETPLGAPEMAPIVYNSGYGILWSKDSSAGDNTRYADNALSAQLSIIGNTDSSPQLTGLSKEEAENILGSPLVVYNYIRISALNSPTKGFYKWNDDLVILYFDTLAPNKVLFAVQMHNDLATKSRFFTSSQLEPYSNTDFETMTMDMINAVRAAYGKAPLAIDDSIAAVARAHSQSMLTDNYFAHSNPSGIGPKDRLKNASIQFKSYGEALTAGTWTPMDAITAWMNSQSHRDILLGDFSAGGVGIAKGLSTYGIYFTLDVIKN